MYYFWKKYFLLKNIPISTKQKSMRLIITFFAFSIPMLGAISLDQMMSREDMEQTGINQLNYTQKKALEKWLDENFSNIPIQVPSSDNQEPIFLSLNVENGAKLKFSDGSIYEIDPNDRIYTIYWITPIPFTFGTSDNPQYPIKITNVNTGTAVKGKPISEKEFLKPRQSTPVEEDIFPTLKPPSPTPPQQPSPKESLQR